MNRMIRKCSKNFILDLSYIYLIVSQATTDGEKNGPKFVEPIPNVTVTVGRDASLPCVVSNLGTYKVVWIHIDRQMVVTMHKHVITRIPRYSITVTGTATNKDTWVLHVTRVQQEDRGYYMCQVNTNPVITQVGYLQVTVPPWFVEDASTSTATVVIRENQNLTLSCRAQGFPPPKIVWKREDGRDIVLSKKNKGPVFSGEIIHFDRINRNDMADYLCIAANGVPPALIKRIFINVEFSPMILVTNQLIASSIRSTTVLECQTEANPAPKTCWMRNGHLLVHNFRYSINTILNGYHTFTRLEIHNTSKLDLGEYMCLSKNALGETEGTIRLYEYITSATEFPIAHTSRVASHKVNGDISSILQKPNGKSSTVSQLYEKSSKSNSSFTPNKGHSLPDIHVHPKAVFNMGIEFSYPSLYIILEIIFLVYRF